MTPVAILSFTAYSNPPVQSFFAPALIVAKVQLCISMVQESVISSIYIWKASHLLRVGLGGPSSNQNHRAKIYQLVAINVVMILMDAGLLIIQFIGFLDLMRLTTYAFYSIKLKLDFAVLRGIVAFVQHRGGNGMVVQQEVDEIALVPDFVDRTRTNSLHSTAPSPPSSRRTTKAHIIDDIDDYDDDGCDLYHQWSRSDVENVSISSPPSPSTSSATYHYRSDEPKSTTP
ncbi:hypothetical protein AJ80_02992 [Polytolypa hystricis UAMH7299]|uniref:DUF7703 domain-containing protein n=1 Tax=Polytolypa hystricis (strain UAMH7299) TaxID=1447883 RepID=A0A2B7YPN0_POLH7|nr:hypothetical protein AJ80_02992 [Polytolypa hystricis UAMH7299]